MVVKVENLSTKQIHELDPLNKLNGKEEVLIDNGALTYRVTVDTLLGYIRDQINGGTGGRTLNEGTLHFIPEGETVDINAREVDHFYINAQKSAAYGYRTGALQVLKVSPNMGLRMIYD